MDYIFEGKTRYFYRRPPKIENSEAFVDGLAEIIPKKVNELYKKMQELKRIRQERIMKMKALKPEISEISYFFGREMIRVDFQEYYVAKKWMAYWLRLSYFVNEIPRKSSITDLDIQKAREYPLQDLYAGQLKHMSGKHQGLCPFHDEKTSSFYIFEKTNSYYCFGCHASGDAIDFIMKLEGKTFINTVKYLGGI